MTTQQTKKQTLTTYLIYFTIALLIINFVLIFLPYLEIYQPSFKKTNPILGITTYEDWYTDTASMATFVFPILLPGIPYLFSILSLLSRNKNSSFFKIKDGTLTKPVHFILLKFSAIISAISLIVIYSTSQDAIADLVEHGAYCRLTFFGILNIICTLVFIVLLFVFSHKTKSMFVLVNKTQVDVVEKEQATMTQEIE